MVDLVAAELGIDRAEIRRKNLVRPEDMPYESGVPDVDTGHPANYIDGDYPATFDALIDGYGYEAMLAEAEDRRGRGETIGVGVTAFVEMGNPGHFEQSRVVAEPDGTFVAHVGVASVGQGVETVLGQIAADRLGVPLERVRISYKDTDIIPEGMGAFSSRATVFGGNAIVGAIREMNKNATEAAAKHFEVDPSKVVIEGGEARVKRGKRSIPLGMLQHRELGIEGSYRYEPGEGSHVLMGANLALVGVDPGTGGVELLRYGISYDIGRAINPLTLEGQVRGAAVQGMGGALLEEFFYGEDGQPLSTSFMDYAMPTAAEVCDIDVFLLQSAEAEEDNPLAGAKGGGEGGIIGTAATIANAVADALGVADGAFLTLPLTPEKVRGLVGSGNRAPAVAS
jgi:carbon-monoxide dehydrogenase large subunit